MIHFWQLLWTRVKKVYSLAKNVMTFPTHRLRQRPLMIALGPHGTVEIYKCARCDHAPIRDLTFPDKVSVVVLVATFHDQGDDEDDPAGDGGTE